MGLYKYRFPVGDWSDDGHGKCDYFIVSGDKPVEEVGRAHNSCIDVLGFHIGDICSNYEESDLRPNIQDILSERGFDLDKFDQDEDGEVNLGCTDQLVELWIDILNYLDPTLNLTVEKDDYPSFQHYANRCPGYGCHY